MSAQDLFNKDDDTKVLDEELSKCEEELASSGGGGNRNYFKIAEGEAGNKVRLLPPLKGIKTPWYHVPIHFNLMGANGKKLPVLCGKDNFGECPLCEDAQMFRDQGDGLKAWNAAAKDQFLYNIITEDGEFAVLTAPKKLQQELIKQFKFARSDDGGEYNPWDIEQGCYVKIVKTKGKKEGNQKFPPNVWSVHLLKRTAVDAEMLEKAAEGMTDLKSMYRLFNVEELNGLLNGTFNPFEKNDEADDVAAPAPANEEKAGEEAPPAIKDDADEVSPPVNVEEDVKDVDEVLDETDELTKKFLNS